MVQIFPWFKIFQTSLIFTFLCLKSITIIRDKEKQKLNWFEKFKTKEKFEPQHMHHAFWYISLPSLHDYDRNMVNFTRYGGHKQTTSKFSFSFYTRIWFLRIRLKQSLLVFVVNELE